MNWLNRMFEFLSSWVPKIWLVGPDESGVRTTLGKYYRAIPPGWYVFWPMIQSVTKITVTVQVVDLREQGLTTRDNKSLAISGAVEYTVRDSVKAILSVQDVDRSLPTLCLGKIAEYVELHDFADCTSEKIKIELRKEVREHVNAWGVSVKHIYITDRVAATAYKIMLSATTAPIRLISEAI